MADRIRLALWWHMHQPCYRNSFDSTLVMPLTFMHATKDYYDMLHLCRKREKLAATFNLVPSLLDQIGLSSSPGSDIFLETLLKPVDGLPGEDLVFLFDFLFLGNVRRQILPLKRYYQLYEKYERDSERGGPAGIFTAQEILDLEVLFLLAWTGTVLREEEPMIRGFLRKGSGFTQGEKEELVGLLRGRVGGIVGAYSEAGQSGNIEITTTPYYHPILPLLHDFSTARALQKDLPLPASCRGLSEDAPLHVSKALALYRETFGVPCRGMWPAEGAVSMESLALMARSGILYAGSDEEVLANSLGVPFPGFGGRREDLYHPWRLQTPEGEIGVFFRDRELSDLIGFTYQRVDAAQAVSGFMSRLHEIRKSLKTDDAIVPVILDGENAWEHYPNNGREFLDRLYDALESDKAVKTVTLGQAAESDKWRELPRIVPGSWIGGRLSTWVGHPEKNRAWELVCRTRESLAAALPDLDEDSREKAREQVLIGEGSDWFWWFGDDHFTTLAARFDELFRLHLINGFRYAGLEAVPELLEPVRQNRPRGHLSVPTDVVTPVLDGRITHYFEWLHAGHFDLDLDRGAMHRSDPVLRDLHYGFDAGFLYLLLKTTGDFSSRAEGLTLEIETAAPRKIVISLDISGGGMSLREGNGPTTGLEGVAGKVAEIGLPLDLLGAVPGQDILMSFTLLKGGESVEKAPMFSLVKIAVPGDYDLEYWIV